MARFLVTGGAGYVGSHVVLALVERGDYVIVHVGYALTKLDPDEAQRTLQMFAEAGLVAGEAA